MKKRSSTWLIALILIFGVTGILFLATRSSAPTQPDEPIAITADDRALGPAEAPVAIVEYSDFQCPACAQYHSMLKQANEEFAGKIRFVYRHFPLRQIHPHAQLSAQAAEAAGAQGKFWEMHNLLFAKQFEWSRVQSAADVFIGYAESLGLDKEQFKTDMNSKTSKDAVNDDYASGLKLKIQGTPTFFINGKQIVNPRSYDELRSLIQSFLSPA